MARPIFRNLHIVANTSSSTEAFARRTNEISRFVSGIGRQSTELERNIAGDTRLSLIRTHPDSRDFSSDGPIHRHTIPLNDTIGLRNPNNIYRECSTLDGLLARFEPLIEHMAGIAKDADVVLLGGTYFVPWCLMQAARRHKKPVVLCYAGILSMEIGHLPAEMQATLKIMEQDFYDPKIFYVFPSELTRRTVQRIFSQELPKSEVVFNGVPPEFLAVSHHPERETAVAFVGRNTPVKNPEFLLSLKQSLEQLGRSYPIRMVTGIDPANPLIRKLRREGIAVLEPLDTPRLAEFYASSGIIVSPSIFETFGNVPLEAVSTGTPALVSTAMGVSEVFGRFGLGNYVTEFGDPRPVAALVDEKIRGREQVPENVRQRIRDELNWPRIIRRYLDICLMHAHSAA